LEGELSEWLVLLSMHVVQMLACDLFDFLLFLWFTGRPSIYDIEE